MPNFNICQFPFGFKRVLSGMAGRLLKQMFFAPYTLYLCFKNTSESSWRLIFLQIERSIRQVNSRAYKPTKAQYLSNTSIHQLTKSLTYKLTNSSTLTLISSKPHQFKILNSYLLFYKVALTFVSFQRKFGLKSR